MITISFIISPKRISRPPLGFLYYGQWGSTPFLAANLHISSWVIALNSFVLPIQEVERQSCSFAGSTP